MRPTQRESILSLMKFRNTTPSEEASAQIFEKYFEEYWLLIQRFLVRMLGDSAEAEDLALETFYRLYRRQPHPGLEFNVRGWLYRVAANLGLQSIRGFKRRERYELSGATSVRTEISDNGPATIFDEEEEKRLARLVLARMNPRQSQLLLLRYSGMAYKDIAGALNLSPTSIGPLLLRAEREFEKRYRAFTQEDL
jgi:RNA polymerase sigma factor (sigma-70 family)